ncbi:unnamed protein product [Caretta caretta]
MTWNHERKGTAISCHKGEKRAMSNETLNLTRAMGATTSRGSLKKRVRGAAIRPGSLCHSWERSPKKVNGARAILSLQSQRRSRVRQIQMKPRPHCLAIRSMSICWSRRWRSSFT